MAIEGYTNTQITQGSQNLSSALQRDVRLHYVADEIQGGYFVTVELQLKSTNTNADTTTADSGSAVVTVDGVSTTTTYLSADSLIIDGTSTWTTIASATKSVSAINDTTINIGAVVSNLAYSGTGGNPTAMECNVSGSIFLPAVASISPKIYGSVNSLSTLINTVYGSSEGRGRQIYKIYGSVDGLTRLVHVDLGEIPRPGVVTYYTDSSHTTTATARIITQTDLDNLGVNSDTWIVTLDGVSIDNVDIKEVTLPTWATSTPNNFLRGCTALDTLDYSINLNTIGNNFLLGCENFNDNIDLFYISSIGDGFLQGCESFNQVLDLTHITTVPDNFLSGCEGFNQNLDLVGITSIGDNFLYGAISFDKPLDLNTVTSIGDGFLSGCVSFNRSVVVPYTMEEIGNDFMYNCDNMVSILTVNAPATIIPVSNNTLSTDNSMAPCYTSAIKISGGYAVEWKQKFPNRDITPYRNLGYGYNPILLNTELSLISNGVKINYGVSTWDIHGTYVSGTVTLYGSTNPYPTTMIDSYNNTGVNIYSHTGLEPNTRYFYRASAINNGGFEAENISSIVTYPAEAQFTFGTSEYITYNTYTQPVTITIPANGNIYPQSVYIRYTPIEEGEPGASSEWVLVDTYSSTEATTLSTSLTLETDTEYYIETEVRTTAGNVDWGDNLSSKPTHIGPQDVQFTLDDSNTSVQSWLSTFDGYSTGNWFISGQSTPRVIIPVQTSGTTTDSASITQYNVSITNPNNGYSATITYDSSSDMSYVFDMESILSNNNFGIVMSEVEAEDSLQATVPYYEGGMFLSWTNPTFTGNAERLGRIGGIKLSFSGSYSGLNIGALNHGNDLNNIELEYRVLSYAGVVLTDWTQIPSTSIRITEVQNTLLDRAFSGQLELTDLDYVQSISVEIRAKDHFETCPIAQIPLNTWSSDQELKPATYEIELWDWKTNTFVADLSYLVAGDLDISWELNDIEELNFNLDLINFEKKCKEMGVESSELLKPYKHDVRVRRNGKYILGCQLVEANIQIPNNSPALINVKCTGFLNLFKDQYLMDETWSGYTYAEIARKLVQAAQKPDCLIKNPTGDIDTSYWLSTTGTVSSSTASYNGDRCIMCSRSGTGWVTMGTQMSVDSGENIVVDVWVKGQSGIVCQIRERQYITQSSNQVSITNFSLNGNWQHIQVPYTTFWDNGYIIIEMNRTSTSTNLYIDDCYIYAQNDDASLCDLKVPLGVDTASPVQQNNRQVNYSLQNVKDAIIDLTNMDDDNFDFDFSYDRTFNCYSHKGETKLGVEILYPGNVETMNIGRSASNLANKVYNIGSGIGDERLQVKMTNIPSRNTYGTRESIVTNSNVELESTLTAQAIGELYNRKDPTNLPTVTIRDGSINPDVVQIGDSIPVSIQGDEYLDTINDIYRIVKIDLTVDTESLETMKLTFEPLEQHPQKRMVRYIRDTLVGNSNNTNKHWREIEALVLVGNEYVNVAKGAVVYGSASFVGAGSYATDGSITTASASMDATGRQGITIDLGAEYPVDYIKVWHYYPDGRTYYGEHLSVGTELPDGTSGIGDLETLVWAYDDGKGYVETSAGKRSKWLQANQVSESKEDSSIHMIRYIRESHIGNSKTVANLWAEVQASLLINGYQTNTLMGRARFYTSTMLNTGSAIAAMTDNDTSTYVGAGVSLPKERRSITIDLGGLYPVDFIKLFHYTADTRIFYGSRLSVGTELPGEANGLEDLETLLWSDGDATGVNETTAGRVSSWLQALPNNTTPTPRMVRYIKHTYQKNNTNSAKTWRAVNAYMFDKELGGLRDIAIGKTATYTATATNPKCATDGTESTYSQITTAGYQSIIIDLGAEYPIDYIRILNDTDSRGMTGSRLSVGTALVEGNDPLETVIWDDGEDWTHIQTSTAGRWSGWLQSDEPQKTYYVGNKRPVRYIRDSISGNSVNGSNHWVEIMAYQYINGAFRNIAIGKTVTASFTPSGSGHTNLQMITDGNSSSDNYVNQNANNARGSVTVDLGAEYYIDYVRVWHYYSDGRSYKSPLLSVGTTLPNDADEPLEYVLNNGQTYTENSSGFGCISKWVQGDL